MQLALFNLWPTRGSCCASFRYQCVTLITFLCMCNLCCWYYTYFVFLLKQERLTIQLLFKLVLRMDCVRTLDDIIWFGGFCGQIPLKILKKNYRSLYRWMLYRFPVALVIYWNTLACMDQRLKKMFLILLHGGSELVESKYWQNIICLLYLLCSPPNTVTKWTVKLIYPCNYVMHEVFDYLFIMSEVGLVDEAILKVYCSIIVLGCWYLVHL